MLQETYTQLSSEKEDEDVRKQLVDTLKEQKKIMDAGSAVLPHLEWVVVNRACSDPGASVVNNLVLPIVRERIEIAAKLYFAAKRAKAEQEMIREEVSNDLT